MVAQILLGVFFNFMSRLSEVIKLPSNGKLYDINELTIQNMTVAEEKFLLGSNGNKSISTILSKCVLDGEKIDFNNLIEADRFYLLVRIRCLTYGEDYDVNLRCANCNKTFEHTIKLSELDVDELDENFKDHWEFELPACKDVITMTIPRVKDNVENEKLAKKKSEKFHLNMDEVRYIFTMMLGIEKVNGQDMLPDELYTYVSNLSGKDSAFIRKQMSQVKVGYDTNLETDCPHCGETFKFTLPMSSSFFLA